MLLEKLTRFVEWPGQPFANRAFVLAVVGSAQVRYCAPFMPLIAFLIAAVFAASPSRV